MEFDFIKENDVYFKVNKKEVEATIFARNESGDVEEVTGFTYEYDREEVSQDQVLEYYNVSIVEMNKVNGSIEELENKLEELNQEYDNKKVLVSEFEKLLPSELHAEEESDEEADE